MQETVAVGQLALTDPELIFGWTGALLFWLESRDDKRPITFVISAVCLGIALLAKGPVAVFLFAATALWTYRVESSPPLSKGHSWALYALIVAAVGCVWYIPAYLGAPKDFVEIFILKQNVGRLLGGDDAHG